MSNKQLSIGVVLLVVIACFLILRYTTNSYDSSSPASSSVDGQTSVKDWVDFTAPTGKFNVKLPTFPQHATENLIDSKTKEIKNYNMYVAQQSNGTTYMISLTTYPNAKETLEKEEEELETIVNDLVVANPNNKIKNMHPSTFQNVKSIDFSIESGEMTIDGKAFRQNKTLYMLTMVANKTNYSEKDSNFFINSFKLLPGPSKAKTSQSTKP